MKIESLKLKDFFSEQIAFPETLAFSELIAEPIDHILARAGVCSLRAAGTFLKNNDVHVGGERITSRSFRVDSEHTSIFINGEQLPFTEHLYLIIDKPLGVVCSRVSDRHQTIFDILPEEIKSHKMYEHLHCVGRLDADTSGLVILTTNGVFSNYMMSPKNHVAKTYEVTLRDEVPSEKEKGTHGVLTQADYVERFKNGIELPPEKKSAGFKTASSELVWGGCRPGESQCSVGKTTSRETSQSPVANFCTLTIHEGKFHQVRRMFAALGNEVIALRRIRYSNLQLSNSMLFVNTK